MTVDSAQTPDGRLRKALSDLIAAVDPTLATRLDQDPEAFLDLIDLTRKSGEELAQLLKSAVSSARSAGLSWERIGQRLGMSRQAAQQRFGATLDRADAEASSERRRLHPVTAFDEMEALATAGVQGWHSIGYGMYFHDLIRSHEQWEHLRVAAFGPTKRSLEADGWKRIGTMWFPWAYYARATGIPIEIDGEPSR
ncbi:hypothetical protein FB472_1482 [Rhodoglobus vestalii]|uniref:Uncharacterized protein n=1 Tax=Rhodoglobus vestalii TaxID=193384 RepID=A0A8H2PUN5_9MICO|nr:hypothetical protein [Rhodoglobus vestalii]TQO19882.1 hypothetical protein FB472_1482 [Rhodoglobus vestalii]